MATALISASVLTLAAATAGASSEADSDGPDRAELEAALKAWTNGEPAELAKLPDDARGDLARGANLWPTWGELEMLEGFVDGGNASRDSDVLEIVWHGPQTQELEDVRQRAADRGLVTTLIEARFDKATLEKAVLDVAAALETAKINYDGVGPKWPYAGLKIDLPLYDAEASTLIEAKSVAERAMPGIPIEVVPYDTGWKPGEKMNIGTATSRQNDTGSVDAGSTTRNNHVATNGNPCTTGLNFTRPGNPNYQLQAAHCTQFVNNVPIETWAGGLNLGISRGVQIFWGTGVDSVGPRLDAGLIELDNPPRAVSTSVFVGSATTSTKSAVAATSSIPYNQGLCVSGGSSGFHCQAERNSEQVLRCIELTAAGACVRHANIVAITSTNPNQVVIAQGDSGGPVFWYTNTGGLTITSIVEGFRNGFTCSSSQSFFWNFTDDGVFCTITGGRVTALSSIGNALAGLGFDSATTSG
ncbi:MULTISPECIES: trypsin-like serine protease [unclassified Nocardioides]|uniref:trypsin-like serine protease n=1 Tax=unclassified Nocardioides TaxID=2615069 RepID=UPI00138F796A|nr:MULTISPECIES: trypsin-like serine protease [unclassified Nocardioides]